MTKFHNNHSPVGHRVEGERRLFSTARYSAEDDLPYAGPV
ncbi:hypothetical protein I546_3086 [Mycobacterium kansasii 732]|uniref:Uncharacterized protein n=1 Tax=Mycobacterium pseudokansasii TaxID=2341080 RepID=A0A498R047_9MYCO|nr:hypothetical protein I546_3086 [Mycobacterium kansasii 732]VBA30084.1 hypothetical protein LAUMK35_04640 [Mycobacterium pseudokansasii]VBA31673.1 hypothetical protein LAUMK21_04633 [Mycobacterium pseudokansasii]VBA54214.1 hypothetical protein LAUMK142_04539 [Mycobacterium pseudokansasii]